MSSYEELVHDPMSPSLTSSGHPFFLAVSPRAWIGVARSGVYGPAFHEH